MPVPMRMAKNISVDVAEVSACGVSSGKVENPKAVRPAPRNFFKAIPLAHMLEEFAGAGVVREALLLGAKFAGVRLQPAGRRAQGMLHVQHFVIQDEFHRVGGHFASCRPGACSSRSARAKDRSTRTGNARDAHSIPGEGGEGSPRNTAR